MPLALRLLTALAASVLLLPWQDGALVQTVGDETIKATDPTSPLSGAELIKLRQFLNNGLGDYQELSNISERNGLVGGWWIPSNEEHGIPKLTAMPTSNISGAPHWQWVDGRPCGATQADLRALSARMGDLLILAMHKRGRSPEQIETARSLLAQYDSAPDRRPLESVIRRLIALEIELPQVQPCD